MIKLVAFSRRRDFKEILDRLGLQARGSSGVDSKSVASHFDISNVDRLGLSEIELANVFIEGASLLIRWEKQLIKKAAGFAGGSSSSSSSDIDIEGDIEELLEIRGRRRKQYPHFLAKKTTGTPHSKL